jgi:hypothetical protein
MSKTISLEDQKTHLDNLLQKLNGIIKKLPTTLPWCSKNGPIAKRLSDHMYDATKGSYYTFNSNWERVFQCAEDQKKYLIIRGKYSLDLV